MKILAIGDIHGQNIWKKFEDINKLLSSKDLIPKYDKYIFLGDYVDSYHIKGNAIKQNLLDIIKLKKNYPEHIVLLLGNHDLHYIFDADKHQCSGYNIEYADIYHKIFTENLDLFGRA